MSMNSYYVYIMTNHSHTLYIGVTSNLQQRVIEHKTGKYKGFTKKYNVDKLVYYEVFGEIKDAIAAEKKLKGWRREKKINLIETNNPHWFDLADNL